MNIKRLKEIELEIKKLEAQKKDILEEIKNDMLSREIKTETKDGLIFSLRTISTKFNEKEFTKGEPDLFEKYKKVETKIKLDTKTLKKEEVEKYNKYLDEVNKTTISFKGE